MSGLVRPVDLCAQWAARVRPGWRGRWPCTGTQELYGEGGWRGLAECTCGCHAGGPAHELPKLADRTAVHPTDVLADE